MEEGRLRMGETAVEDGGDCSGGGETAVEEGGDCSGRWGRL